MGKKNPVLRDRIAALKNLSSPKSKGRGKRAADPNLLNHQEGSNQPSLDQYETFGNNAFDVFSNDLDPGGASATHEGMGDMAKVTKSSNRRLTAAQKQKLAALRKKAGACIKIATLMLPNGNRDAVKNMATDLMGAPPKLLRAMGERLVYSAKGYELRAAKDAQAAKLAAKKAAQKRANEKKRLAAESENLDALSSILNIGGSEKSAMDHEAMDAQSNLLEVDIKDGEATIHHSEEGDGVVVRQDGEELVNTMGDMGDGMMDDFEEGDLGEDVDFEMEGDEGEFEMEGEGDEGEFEMEFEGEEEDPFAGKHSSVNENSDIASLESMFQGLEQAENPSPTASRKMQPRRSAAKRKANPKKLDRVKKATASPIDESKLLEQAFMGSEEHDSIAAREFFNK